MKKLLCFLLACTCCFGAPEKEERITAILVSTGYDKRFLEDMRSIYAEMEQRGDLPNDAHRELLEEISAQGYLRAASVYLSKTLSDEDITALLSYLQVASNAKLFGSLQIAVRKFSGDALQERFKEFEAQDPELWKKAIAFYQSPVALRFAQAMEGMKPVERQASIDETLRAREVIIHKRKKPNSERSAAL